MVYTFDVFDTLISRRTVEPRGVFYVMQEKLKTSRGKIHNFSSHICFHFADFRVDAEIEARNMVKKNGESEVSLEQIYTMFGIMNGIDNEQCQMLSLMEIETEYEMSIPIEENIELLKQLKKEHKVFLISDMYLPEKVIRNLLLKHDDVFQDIPIIVSCESKRRKHDGKLYSFFLQNYSISPSEWVHFGDNLITDGKAVEKIGGKWIEFDKFRVTERDKKILDNINRNIELELFLGNIKEIRGKQKHLSLPFSIGLEIASPIFYGYIKWILSNAKEFGYKHLFFIARDGFVLKEIADYIIQEEKLEISTHCLYGSRRAWRLPAVATDLDSLKKWFMEECRFNSISQLARVFELSQKEIVVYMPKQLSSGWRLSQSEINIVKLYLLLQNEFWEKVYKKISRKRALAIKYLEQELAEKDNIAFVELNGTGYTLNCISRLLKGIYDEELNVFYYSLWGMGNICRGGCNFMKYSYKTYADRNVIELLSRAPYGQTIGYTENKGRIEPVIDASVKDYISTNFLKEYLDGLIKGISILQKSYFDINDIASLSLSYLDYAIRFEDHDLQIFMGDMPFASNSYDSNANSYAPCLTEVMMDKIESCTYRHEWRNFYAGERIDYSIMRTSEPTKSRMVQFLQEEGKRPLDEYRNIVFKGKIILYGAGCHGKYMYEYLQAKEDVEIVHWVDKNYMNMCRDIESPDAIFVGEYDFVFIAVLSIKLRQEIYQELIDKGIPISKIF